MVGIHSSPVSLAPSSVGMARKTFENLRWSEERRLSYCDAAVRPLQKSGRCFVLLVDSVVKLCNKVLKAGCCLSHASVSTEMKTCNLP